MRARRIVALAFAVAGAGCDPSSPSRDEVLTIYAGASTAPVVEDLARRFEARSGVTVICSFAATSTLARQVEAGAPADVFVSANERWMDELERHGAIEAESRRVLFGNALVVVAAAGAERAPVPLVTAVAAGRIACGDPEHVPLGLYAKQALESAGAWNDDLQRRLLPAPDARAALRLVEMGAAEVGVVYASDAAASARVQVIARVPPEGHDPIRYSVAVCRGADPRATAFMEYLRTTDLGAVARAHHFLPAAP